MEKLVICSIMIFAIVGINISLFTDESNKQEREYFYKNTYWSNSSDCQRGTNFYS